jgi:hypothetical protein
MKFRYKKYAPGVLRPVIPIYITYQYKIVPYEVLVDSGADINIFDAQIGDILGIDLKSGTPRTVSGVTGVGETYYLHKVELTIGGYSFANIEVGFLEKMGPYSYGIVGQRGFFDLFAVKFDLKKEQIELIPKRN